MSFPNDPYSVEPIDFQVLVEWASARVNPPELPDDPATNSARFNANAANFLRAFMFWMQAHGGGAPRNVKVYGARGDGSTNDTNAIQDAIDAAFDYGGGIVFFPFGSYVHDALTLRAGVRLVYVTDASPENALYGTSGDVVIRTAGGSPIYVKTGGAGTTGWTPTLGEDHGGLTGLGDDDHLQYAILTGARHFTGDLLVGTSASSASPTIGLRKTGAGASTLGFRTADGADTSGDKRIQQDANEDFRLDNYNGTTWDSLVQVTANTVRLPGLASLSGLSFFEVGDASGSPAQRVRKSGAGTGTLVFTTGTGSTNGDKQFVHDANEDLLVQARISGSFTTYLRVGTSEIGQSVPTVFEDDAAYIHGADSADQAGGALILQRGAAGGGISLISGDGLDNDFAGGPINIEGGDGTGTGDGGAVSITAGIGAGSGDGGNLSLIVPDAPGGASGAIRFVGRRADTEHEQPSAMGSTENNYNPGGSYPNVTVLRLTPAGGGTTMTGLVAGISGQRVLLINESTTDSISLSNLSGSSSSNNQFRCPNSATFVIRNRGSIDLAYVGSKWQVVAA